MATSNWGNLYTQAQAAWNALPLEQRLQGLGYQQQTNDYGTKWGMPDNNGQWQILDAGTGGEYGDQTQRLNDIASWNGDRSYSNARQLFSQYGILPLDNNIVGNGTYNDAMIAAQRDGSGGLMAWLNARTPGGGQIVNDPTLGRLWVANNPADAANFYKDTAPRGGGFPDKFAEGGGLVKLLGGAVLGAGGFLGGGTPLDAFGNLISGNGVTIPSDLGVTGGWDTFGAGQSLSGAQDLTGLTQMGQAAGLSGQQLTDFINSGGTMGSTAAGGGGIGTGYVPSIAPSFPGVSPTATPPQQVLPDVPPVSPPLSTGSGNQSPPVDLNGNPIGNVDEFGNPISDNTLGVTPLGATTGTSLLDQINKLLGGSGGSNSNSGLASLLNGLLGLYGADASRSANNAAADKMLALGAPARAAYNASITPGFDPTTIPGYSGAVDSAMQTYLRKASTGGNPFSNPGISAEALNWVNNNSALPAINAYRSSLVNAGGIGVPNANGPNQTAANALNSGVNAVSGAVSNALNPPTDWASILKNLGSGASGLSSILNFSNLA